MPCRKAKAPNDFCDPKADDVRVSPSSSATPTSSITPSSKAERPNAASTSTLTSSQFTTKAKPATKPPLTHFLCIPLVTPTSRPQLQEALERFKEDVCQNDDVPEKAIRPVGTLHLTLGVMSLDEDALARAVAMLQELDLAALLESPSDDSSVSNPTPPPTTEKPSTIPFSATTEALETAFAGAGLSAATSTCSSAQTGAGAIPPTSANRHDPLIISLRGLHSMHPPSRTSILYAAPHDPTDRLYPAAEKLRNEFMQAGFLVPDDRALKLHATIVNTIYAKAGRGGRGGGHGPNAKALVRLDAKDLMGRYADFVWCEGLQVRKVAICKMGAKRVVDAAGEVVGEEYEEVAAKEL